MLRLAFAYIAAIGMTAGSAECAQPLGIDLEGLPYPFEVRYLPLDVDGTRLSMAYMDIAPAGKANGRTAVLLHGRNFFGAYWKETADFLAQAGWRVVVPDQIGFGKSSKPEIALSFHWLAYNTKLLLDHLGVEKIDLIGHSMGGMLAVRFALMYPGTVERLVLEGPLGLEDYRLLVPYATRDQLIAASRAQTRQSIDRLFRSYFVNWQDRFQTYADVAWRWIQGPGAEHLHRNAASTYAMAYEQPIVYELPLIKARTLIIVGDHDRAALGRDRVSSQVREKIGRLPELASRACKAIADCSLVVLNDTGHVPHLEVAENFQLVLYSFLGPPDEGVFDSRRAPPARPPIRVAETPDWHVDCVASGDCAK